MLSFEEARRQVLALARPMSPARLPLSSAAGRVLAEDVSSPRPLPGADASAMDGYAVATDDLSGTGPWELPVRGESRAGGGAQAFARGSACRILTGALVPEGADAIVMQEDVEHAGDRVRLTRRPNRGEHIRRAGSDLAAGAVALQAGTRLGPGHLALAAMTGRAQLLVSRHPVVAILCSGDELRLPGEELVPGSIYESNGAALGALAHQAGAVAHVGPVVRDDLAHATKAVEHAFEDCDVLVTVGGVSVGDHDVMKAALAAAGVELAFWKVAIKPGKPLAVGKIGRKRVLALPGNPAAALVTFGLFGVPLLRAMQGDKHPLPPKLRARLATDVTRKGGRLEFARARLDSSGPEPVVHLHANQASGAATSLAWSDSLALLPAEAETLAAGTWVDVLRPADF